MARNSARSSIHSAAAVKKASTRNSAECTGLRKVMTQIAATTRIAAKTQKTASSNMVRTHRYTASAAQGVQATEARAHRRLLLGELHRDLAPEEVAPRERHALRQLHQKEGLEELARFFDYVVDHEITICSTASASTRRSPRATRS